MESLYHYCQGFSHIEDNKPCQDCAFSETNPVYSVAIVCDGHGGGRYFRSHIGAEIAVEVTKNAIRDFVGNLPKSSYSIQVGKPLFEGMEFVQYDLKSISEVKTEHQNQAEKIHLAFTGLFSYILTEWRNRINKHAIENDLDDWEIEHVEEKYKTDFLEKQKFAEDPSFEKTYGCTLMVYVQTQSYWFAFHIGDGKCVRLRIVDGKACLDQPIPWDEACFLNGTTSLCKSHALEMFRYCYQGDGTFPDAMFLASDGIDDTFVNDENLNNFYIELYKTIAKGKDVALKELTKSLPILSERRSKDDMSVACVYDESKLNENRLPLVAYQCQVVENNRTLTAKKICQLQSKIENFGDFESLSKKDQIDYQYAEKDLIKAIDQERRLNRKLGGFNCCLNRLKREFGYMNEGTTDDEQLEECSLMDNIIENAETVANTESEAILDTTDKVEGVAKDSKEAKSDLLTDIDYTNETDINTEN